MSPKKTTKRKAPTKKKAPTKRKAPTKKKAPTKRKAAKGTAEACVLHEGQGIPGCLRACGRDVARACEFSPYDPRVG